MSNWDTNVILIDDTLDLHAWITGVCIGDGYQVQYLDCSGGGCSIMGSKANLPLWF